MRLALRPVAPNDYIVLEDRQPIGRIRLARERSPPIWLWTVTVTIPGPPFGDAKSIHDAKALQGGVAGVQGQGRSRGTGEGLCRDRARQPTGAVSAVMPVLTARLEKT